MSCYDEELRELHRTLSILASDYLARLSVAVHQIKTLPVPFGGREQLRSWGFVVGNVTRTVQTATRLFQTDVERALDDAGGNDDGNTSSSSSATSVGKTSVAENIVADLLEGVKTEAERATATEVQSCGGLKVERQAVEEVEVAATTCLAVEETVATVKRAFDAEDFLDGPPLKTEMVNDQIDALSSDDCCDDVKVKVSDAETMSVQSNTIVYGEASRSSVCSDVDYDDDDGDFHGFPPQPTSDDDYVSEILRRINDSESDVTPTTGSEFPRTEDGYSVSDIQSILGTRKILRCYLDRMNRVQIERWTSGAAEAHSKRRRGRRRLWSQRKRFAK